MSNRLTQFLYRLLRDHPNIDIPAHLAQTSHHEAIYSLPDIEKTARQIGDELLAPPLTEAQEQAQAALNKVMKSRFNNFDAGAVIHWAERGLYQVKVASVQPAATAADRIFLTRQEVLVLLRAPDFEAYERVVKRLTAFVLSAPVESEGSET